MFRLLLALSCLTPVVALGLSTAHAQEQEALPSADELLSAMDDTLQFETRTATTTMRVIDARRTREYKMKSFGRGVDEAAVEYLEPDREKGTKMLKKEDQMWLYMPRAERTQKISGHMLRQGMMGSDVSYEDMMEAAEFEKRYDAEVTGIEDLDGRPHYKVVATAKDESVTYPKRIIWIDKEHKIPSKQELYALSGMLMKTWTMSDIEVIEGRPVAKKMVISDQLKEGSRTELLIDEVTFGVPVEEETFSLRWLERK